MITAKRISLVRWYAFDAEDIEIHGDVAFVGDNGAGKSSILDAVQLLMTGGNKNYFRPNARANDSGSKGSRRTVKDYCLGKLSNGQGAVELRGGGPSYAAMTVFDEERQRPISFGIALYADPDESDAHIDAVFIAPNRDLSTIDFLIGGQEGASAAPWAEIRSRCEREIPGFRVFRDQPTAFVKALVQTTRGKGASAEPEQWLRALRLGAQFRGVEDPNQFMRDHILPQDDLDLPALREDARRYSEFVRTIRLLEEKERQLQVVDAGFTAHFENLSDARRNQALAAMARREGLRRQVEIGEETIADYNRQETAFAIQAEQAEERVKAAETRLYDARRALEADPTSGKLESAKARHRMAGLGIERANDGLVKIRSTLAEAARWFAEAEQSSLDGGRPMRRQIEMAADLAAPADLWPRDIDAVKAAGALGPSIDAFCGGIDGAIATATERLSETKSKLAEAIEQFDAAVQGGPILRHETRRLIRALEAEGMRPVPLCAVVDVVDPAWAPALETLLGAAREAILVEQDEVRAAVRRIRRERASFYGCTIVQVAGTERFSGAPSPGSLAEMLRTSDSRARVFINQRLGGIRRVETEAELEGAERAVTVDCQYASGGGIQNRRPVERLILGRRYNAQDVDRLSRERDGAAVAYQATRERVAKLSNVQGRLRDAITSLATLPDIEVALKARREARTEMHLASQAIAELEQARPVELAQAVDDANQDLADCKNDRKDLEEARKTNAVAKGKAETNLETHRENLEKVRETLASLPATDTERVDAERELTEHLAGRHTTTSIAEKAENNANIADAEARRHLVTARRSLQSYWQRHNETSLAESAVLTPGEVEGEARWVSERLDRLRNHELRQYKEAVEEIEAKVRRSLRENLFLALSSRINRAHELIQDLNRHLRGRRFHRERYVFTSQRKPELQEIFQAIEAVKRQPGLFDDGFAAIDGDEAVKRGVDRVIRMLEAEGDAAERDIRDLSDYRLYFTYDVEMRDEVTDKFITTLSERIRTGSGGEKEAPSYVAVGTAIAAANGVEPRHQPHEIGMAIALLDEAFTRLDDANIGNILDLLRQLGLQMLVAAPTSKRFAFLSRFETVVDVLRVGDRVTLQTHYLSEKARRLMREDNPYEVTFETWAAERSRRTAAE